MSWFKILRLMKGEELVEGCEPGAGEGGGQLRHSRCPHHATLQGHCSLAPLPTLAARPSCAQGTLGTSGRGGIPFPLPFILLQRSVGLE